MTFLLILIAILVGAWAGIALDFYVLDKTFGDAEPSFWYYASSPWRHTVKHAWELISR